MQTGSGEHFGSFGPPENDMAVFMNGFLNASGIHINGNPGNFLGGEKLGNGMACAAETTNQHMLVGARLVHLCIGHVMLECGTPFRGATAIDTIRNALHAIKKSIRQGLP